MRPTLRRLAAYGCFCAVLLASGCGKKLTPVYPAKGQLLIGGKPAPTISLLLVPATPQKESDGSDTPLSGATTDEEGNFIVSTYKTGDGAPAGDYTVTLRAPGPQMRHGKPIEKTIKPDPFDAKYREPGTSTLKVTIKPVPNNDLGTLNADPAP